MNGDFIAGMILGSIFMYLFLMLLRDRNIDKKAEKLADLFTDEKHMLLMGGTINAVLSVKAGLSKNEYSDLSYLMYDLTYKEAKALADSNLSNIYEINNAILAILDGKLAKKDEII